MPTETKLFQKKVFDIIAASPTKITPAALVKKISETHGLRRNQVKSLIKELVADGELTYAYEHGDTFLMPSFNRPVRISNSLVIKPSGYHYHPKSTDVVIELNPGASFGDGRHPTTRLAARGIDFVLAHRHAEPPRHQRTVLDIGTGTGILVLAAVKLGMHEGLGIDIDPCARAEARQNVFQNALEDRIRISDQYLEAIDQDFFLVTANLRFPTLNKICSYLRKITLTNGFVVASGIRSHELAGLKSRYTQKRFDCLWEAHELDWAGVVFHKKEYRQSYEFSGKRTAAQVVAAKKNVRL
jgi:ribosomal protein L11 methyltransferase